MPMATGMIIVNGEINHDNGSKEKEKATTFNNKRKRTET